MPNPKPSNGGNEPVSGDVPGKPGAVEHGGNWGEEIIDAATAIVPYPFVRCMAILHNEDGPCPIESWRPGVEFVMFSPEDTEAVANGMGEMRLTVVSRHKPGRFPERVFYTRQWVRPDGGVFGNPKLHIATAEKFKRLCRGYAHSFILDARRVVDGVFEDHAS